MSNGRAECIVGAVPVLVMPFDDDGAIDEVSLRRELDFCIEAGSQAIAFGMGSESAMLTDAERAQVWSLAARQLDGRLPLIAATAHASREGTLALTRLAQECGVTCAMVNPAPYGGEQLVGLFRDLSDRVGLPLMVQDASGNAPAEVLLQAVDAAASISCLKIEAAGTPEKVGVVVEGLRERGWLGSGGDDAGSAPHPCSSQGQALALSCASGAPEAREITVLGGGNGNFLPEELGRGSVGTMPHPALIDGFRTVCDRYAAGASAGGLEVYQSTIAPVLRAVTVSGAGSSMLWLQKTLFQHAGILRSTYCRRNALALPNWLMEQVLAHLDGTDLIMAQLLRAKSARQGSH